MFDGSIDNPLAMVLLAVAFAVAAPAALQAARGSSEATPKGEAWFALGALVVIWAVLTPLDVVNRALGEPMVWIFGREAMDTGVVEYATVLLFLWAAITCAWLTQRGPFLQRCLFGLGAVATLLIAGEEMSWGQWLFHWSTPEVIDAGNLQHETNAHNFLPPEVWELAYEEAGWAMMLSVLALRFLPAARRITFAPLAVFRDSRFAAPLALSAGVMMQHHFLQELAELSLAAAAAFAVCWVAARTPGRRPVEQLVPA